MKKKFNAYQKRLYEFINLIYVVCPSCKNQAIVQSQQPLKDKKEKQVNYLGASPRGIKRKITFNFDASVGAFNLDYRVKLICISCGMNKYYSETSMLLGTNVDPFFRLPLWLQKEISGNILWAYNYEHLTFLENHISASLRNRANSPVQNKSLGARLPKWISSKKNRAELLNGIKKLKEK